MVGTGAIAIDNVRIVNQTSGQTIATEDAEQTGPSLSPGLRLAGNAKVTTEQALDGAASVLLRPGFSAIQTNPAVLPISPNTYYLFELDYRILNPGIDPQILYPWFWPEGGDGRSMLSQGAPEGTFSSGALTADAPAPYLRIAAATEAAIVIDNLRIIRQDAAPATSQPAYWAGLSRTPYPRLGNYQQGVTNRIATDGQGSVPDLPEGQLAYLPDEIEEGLAFYDVVAGLHVESQTRDPAFVRRLRLLNLDVVLLPYRIAQEQWAYCRCPGKMSGFIVQRKCQ